MTDVVIADDPLALEASLMISRVDEFLEKTRGRQMVAVTEYQDLLLDLRSDLARFAGEAPVPLADSSPDEDMPQARVV